MWLRKPGVPFAIPGPSVLLLFSQDWDKLCRLAPSETASRWSHSLQKVNLLWWGSSYLQEQKLLNRFPISVYISAIYTLHFLQNLRMTITQSCQLNNGRVSTFFFTNFVFRDKLLFRELNGAAIAMALARDLTVCLYFLLLQWPLGAGGFWVSLISHRHHCPMSSDPFGKMSLSDLPLIAVSYCSGTLFLVKMEVIIFVSI